MHNRSSISSSESSDSNRSRLIVCGTSLIASFLLLATLNYVLARATLPYKADSRIGKVIRYLRYESSRGTDSPSVIFMGSSRFHSCIFPSVFDAYAVERGVDARFINVAQNAMEYWDFSKVVSFVDLKAMNAKVCVIEVNPWTFNKKKRHQAIAKKIVCYSRELESCGTVRDAWAVEGVFLKCKLVMKVLVSRRSVMDWLHTARGIYRGGPEVSTLPPPAYHLDLEKEVRLRNNPIFFAENVSRCHMMDYEFSTVKRDQFLAFIDNLKMQGIEVVLVQPPVRKRYFEYVNESAERSSEYQKHIEFMKGISGQYATLFWQVPGDVGLDESVFVDYGHFSLEGGPVFSELLAVGMDDIIKRLKLSD